MKLYNNFIGIDIGKFSFVTSLQGSKKISEYENTPSGIADFIRDHKENLAESLCILETTGGYEMELLTTLYNEKFAVHRANTRKVKNFIRSFGNGAKTDALDAKALALYGFERQDRLELFKPQIKLMIELSELVSRRNDLKQILVAEKNRLKAPGNNFIKSSCKNLIETVSEEIKSITNMINEKIATDKIL